MLILSITFSEVLFWLYALLMFIIVLGVIILLHEGGHWFFAHKAGILCHEYSIGMGPLIHQWKKKGSETSISIRAIPIGGYVSMAGEDTNEEMLKEGQKVGLCFEKVYTGEGEEQIESKIVSAINLTDKVSSDIRGTVVEYDLYAEHGEEMWIKIELADTTQVTYPVKRDAFYVFNKKTQIQLAPYDRCFESKKIGQRAITIFAGPMMNFVLALAIFFVVSFATGVPNYDSTVVGDITKSYPAETAGIKKGDEIVSINGTNVSTWNEFSDYLNNNSGIDDVALKVKRGEEEKVFDLKPVIISYRLGVANFESTDYTGAGLKVSLVFDDNYVVGKAGVKNGDVILGYYDNNTYVELNNWKQLLDYISSDPNMSSIKIKVEGKGDITSNVWTVQSLGDLGLEQETKTAIGVSCGYHFDFGKCFLNSFVLLWNSIATVFATLGALFANSQISINDLSGPVGIYSAVKSYLQTDAITFLSFAGLISANIGVVNLLPIPALDGGRLVFLGYEAITKKRVPKKVETKINDVVFWIVMVLFVYITCKDIIRLF